MSYTTYTADAIKKFGDIPIVSIELRRNPIPDLANKLVNILEADNWTNINFDTYYHLYSVLTLQTSPVQQLKVEKNEVINIDGKPEESENKLNVRKYKLGSLTLNQMLEKTQKRMKEKYYPYDPIYNNCQDFQINFLISNGLSDSSTTEFIKQSTEKLAKATPGFMKQLTNKIMEIAGWLRTQKEKWGFKKGGIVPFKHKQKKHKIYGK